MTESSGTTILFTEKNIGIFCVLRRRKALCLGGAGLMVSARFRYYFDFKVNRIFQLAALSAVVAPHQK